MALNNVNFVLGKGGLGRPLPGQDYISGLLFYAPNANLPSGFTTSNRIVQMFGPADAITNGIKADYSDETQATGTLTVANIGATSDVITINVIEPNSTIVAIGTYTHSSTDTTISLVATGITNAINSNTLTTGYKASSVGAVITITARKGLGVFLNTGTPISTTITGGILPPGIPTLTGSTTGGTLAAATYYYKITALNASGETVGSPEASVVTTGTTSSVAVSWTAVTGATSYKIYRGTTAGSENTYYTSTTASFTDTGAAGTAGTVPTVNTTILTATITQFTGGIASLWAIWNYHISEYFRIRPQGNLYVGIYPVPSPYTFTEITTMQNFANGNIRQIGVFKDPASPFASADITAIHNVCAANVTGHKEIIALYGADISGTSDVSTLADLSLLTANYCSAVIGQDGAALGSKLYFAYGKSITCLGATLGAVAKAKVSQSIAWVANFNISNGTEFDTLAFANGVLFSNTSVTDALLTTMQNMRYIFLRKFVGVAGSYFNENSTSIVTTSDYAYIADNRTIQKATRGIYSNVVSALNSPITLNSDGTLSNEAISYFTGLADAPLIQMIRDGELSGRAVSINAAQNIVSTGILTINVSLVQIATGRNITVNIGYRVAV